MATPPSQPFLSWLVAVELIIHWFWSHRQLMLFSLSLLMNVEKSWLDHESLAQSLDELVWFEHLHVVLLLFRSLQKHCQSPELEEQSPALELFLLVAPELVLQ